MSTISQMINKNRFLALFLILLISIFVALFIWLKIGIKIESLNFSQFKISQLYIKLDNKITLRVKNIDILPLINEKNNTKPSLEFLHYLSWIDMLFETIEFKNITNGEHKSYLIYADNKFNLNNTDLYINANFARQNHNLNVAVNEITLKDFNTTINGYLELNFYNDKHKFSGKFNSYELSGNLGLNIENNILTYELSDVSADTIEQFMNALASATGLDNEIKNWI